LINVVIPPLEQPFTYSVPQQLVSSAQIGSCVAVPFRNRTERGFIIAHLPESARAQITYKVRSILSSTPPKPCFLASQIEFMRWIADYYGDALSSVIDVAVPPDVPAQIIKTVRLVSVPEPLPRARIQRELLTILKESDGAIDCTTLNRRLKGASSAVKALEAQGIVTIDSREIIDQHISQEAAPLWAKTEVELNQSQLDAVQMICSAADQRTFAPILLHGITGSGKTEVYIEAIQHVIAAGRGALLIVPEIALTPQVIDRFRARLGSGIAILHSGLHRRVRWDSWRALLEGRNRIAIGARSAVFAPVPNLGLLIVDEEHDGSYKQNEGLRYNGRDLALVRGKLEKIPVVLGSATPSLETFHSANTKRFAYMSLPARHAGATRPTVEVIDLNKIKPWELAAPHVSMALRNAITDTISRNEQVFVLYNRRGFASYLQCEKCEAVVKCHNCCVTMTYHQRGYSLMCHYCGAQQTPSEFCPECLRDEAQRSPTVKPGECGKLVQRGAGTEKILDELGELFPGATIDRLDRDSVTDLDTYRGILDRVRSGQTQILVGTQMIAKGHDLPGVTLVGVADCDVGLHMPDFRAGERVFQMLTQVAGRAGRGERPGRVILQTRVPRHASLQFTAQHNFEGWAECELKARKLLNYPPFVRILRIVASSESQDLAHRMIEQVRDRVKSVIGTNRWSVTLLGPVPAPLSRLKGVWRWHLILKSPQASILNALLQTVQKEIKAHKEVRLIWDMDPQELM